MGSGCSSPLKRFGGRRGKQQQQQHNQDAAESSQHNQDCRKSQDNQLCQEAQLTAGADVEQARGGHEQQPQQISSSAGLVAGPATNPANREPVHMEHEITVQSEFMEDHPSTASYYTDVRNNNEDTRISGISGSLDPKSSSSITRTDATGASLLPLRAHLAAANSTATQGSPANFPITHDRHLLVSPAPSSTCYSPSPALNSAAAANSPADLSALMALFRTLTLGHLQPAATPQTTTNHPQSSAAINQQQLLQTRHDLVNSVSVFLLIADNFQVPTPAAGEKPSAAHQATPNVDTLAQNIETNLKSLAHDHLFNLKFFNISSKYLTQHFRVSNLSDVCFRVMERELADNGQRIVVIILSSVSMGASDGKDRPEEKGSYHLDKKQLPSNIELQTFANLLAFDLPEQSNPDPKELIKKWYTKGRVSYHLNPVYQVYPNILSGNREARDLAWSKWVAESNSIKQMIKRVQDTKPELVADINLFSSFDCCLDFVLQSSIIQKKTLLIRNLTQLPASVASSTSNNNVSSTNQINVALAKDTSLNELSKLLADPNKLTLKQTRESSDTTTKTLTTWINENFAKFLEGILENQIVNRKQVPCFVERNLFIELTSQRQQLHHYIENTSENFLVKCNNFYTNQVSPTIDDMISNAPSETSPTNRDPSITYDATFSGTQSASSHLIFISGHKGCGKSSLFSQIIKLAAQDYSDKLQLIYRFAGITHSSLNTDRLLRSICEQFCRTQGENIIAASYVYSSRKQIMSAINKINKNQASIIFLDGLDDLIRSDDSDIDWLLELAAGSKVRIFIMLEATSVLYKKVLGSYSDATHISLDSPSINEWAQMLSSSARSNRFNSTGNLFDEIRKIDVGDSNEKPLTYNDVNDIMHMCQIRRLNNEVYYLELSSKMLLNDPIQNLKNVHQIILNHLLYLMTPYELASFFIIIDSCRNGLSESDILGIMNMIAQSSKSEWKFSHLLLDYLKLQMAPWLIYIIVDKVVKININKTFTSRAMNFFTSTLNINILGEVRGYLMDYFSRSQSKMKSSKSGSSKGELILNELKENPNFQERLFLATQASETINLLLKTAPTKAKDQILNKSLFFSRFFYGFTPEEFIEDYKTLKDTIGRKSSTGEDVQTMVNYIRQSIYPLRYDGSQIYSQIYCRSFDSVSRGSKSLKSKKFNDLISTASCPPMRNLLPISEASVNSFIRTRIGQLISSTSTNQLPVTSSLSTNPPSTRAQSSIGTSRPTSSQTPSQVLPTRQKIYTIKDNHRYVIVIYPDRGTLSVWDIYEERAARTITNIDQPKDLRMIDQKRAVILCNRELKVYDLDSGLMLTKLKGVMNQKMPYFEVYEDNYVVALARNRMYVNMFNISTGELETTFKVGEDRFLNSLLVSAEGGICVCGDETQKPFPLLVWNLNERRLMYDLRLDKHEFITRMSAISDDGHFVVSVCKQLGDTQESSLDKSLKHSPNFLVIYDLNSGTLFKKWKPGLDSCAVAISMAQDKSRKVINTVIDNSILVWDMATSSKRHTLIGHSAPVDVIKVQNNRLFSMDSTCLDQSLRIWDIDEGYCLSVFSPDAPVSCCQMSIRGDALVCGFTGETRLSTLVMCKNETVNDVVKRNKRRKSSKSLYCFDDPASRKSSQ